MNKVMRVLLLAVLVFAVVMPMAVAAQPNSYVVINGSIYNGTNGGPEVPVVVNVYRDTGGGEQLVRSQTTESERGDFAFVISAVQGYWCIEIEAFVEGGSDALGVTWWQGETGTGRVLKQEAGAAGPWRFCWYQDNDGIDWWYNQIIFEYTSVAGPRANASWMYVGGKVFDPSIWTAMTYNECGDQLLSWQDVDPFQAVEGAVVYVDKMVYDEDTNVALPIVKEAYGAVVTGDKGFWGMGLVREPGMYRVALDPATLPGPQPALMSANPLWFQVFDVYGSGGAPDSYGPGSSWLPWNFMQSEWVYANFNFAAVGTWTAHPVVVPPCP